MPVSITREQLREMNPCGLEARMKLFGRRKSLSARHALAAGATVPDLLWVASRLGRKRECVQFALRCAQRVAHLNPDPRVQAALDATQAWIDAPTDAGAAGAAAWDAGAARAAAWAAARAAARAAEEAEQKILFLEIFG